jgi:hypothetical protein
MSDDLDSNEGLSAATNHFPFVMVLTTTFVLGGMFLIINGPLIILILENKSFSSVQEVLGVGVLPLFKEALHMKEELATGFFFLVLSFFVGLLLTPLNRAITAGCGIVCKIGFKKFAKKGSIEIDPFTPVVYQDRGYPAFLQWLMTKRECKVTWEWSLFNYLLYWAVFTNLVILIVLVVLLEWPHFHYLEILAYVGSLSLFLYYAISHSRVMGLTHKYCLEQKDQSKEREGKIHT